MKNLFKKLLPALALTFLIAGTFAASAFGNKGNQKATTLYWGLPSSGPEISLGENQPDPDEDCDQTENSCYYRVVNGGDPQYEAGGFYKTNP